MTLNSYKTKFIILTIVAAIILCTSCAHKRKEQPVTWLYSGENLEMLNGRVKTLTDLTMDTGKMFIYLVYTFDKKGDLVTVDDIYNGGMNTTKYTTVYDKTGKRAQTMSINIDSLEHRVYGDLYKYDQREHITGFGALMYNPNAKYPPNYPYRFLYDKADCLTERQEWYHNLLVSIRKYKYLYDDNGAVIAEEWASADDRTDCKVFTKDTTRYLIVDSQNNWLKAVRFGNDTLTRKITYY
jgi:hypothetical protein